MTFKTLTILAASVALIGVTACTNNSPADLPPGKYEKTTKSTNADGTTTTRRTTTEVDQDRYGNKSATRETETTSDPKGLFNKSKSTSRSTYYEDR